MRAIARLLGAASLICFAPLVIAQSLGSREAGANDVPAKPGPPTTTVRPRLDYRIEPVAVGIALPVLDRSAFRLEAPKPGVPLQVGFPRLVPESSRGDLLANSIWTTLADGASVTSIAVHAPGANRLRVAVQAVLPRGAQVRFFSLDRAEDATYPVYTRERFERHGADRLTGEAGGDTGGLLWSPIVDGDTLGIEVELAAGENEADARLRIVRISQLTSSAARPAGNGGGLVTKRDEDCSLVDVACKDLAACPTSAVGRMFFTESDGKSYNCSGTAINSTRPAIENTRAPYFLTAEHCISTQNAADSLEIDFFYEHASCDGTTLSVDHTTLYAGAELLVADPATDSSLLELRSQLPDGVCLSGWRAQGAESLATDSTLMSISHPGGEPKKYASGSFANPVYGTASSDDSAVDILRVEWSEGLTLPGSSGSGLFAPGDDGEHALIGALSGGPAGDEACTTRDFYGRFDLFYFNQAQPYLNSDDPVEDDHGGAVARATGVLLNSELSARIDHAADVDMFRFVVAEPGLLTVSSTGGIDTVGRLFSEDGSIFDWDDDGGDSGNFYIAAQLEPGVYYVRVNGYEPSSVGNYRLRVVFTADDNRRALEIPLFLSASRPGREGFIRLFNASDNDGTVMITAYDDEGARHGPVTLSIDAQETRHFNSGDLESGNSSKGLGGKTGSGSGDWRLRFETELEIDVATYIRTEDGFLTVVHDVVPRREGRHLVSIFNPGSNTDRLSKLRLVNPNATQTARARITGQDDAGHAGAGAVELTLPPGGARTVDAVALEAGSPEFDGRLGDGQGKWRLFVEANGEIVVLNLLDSVSGHLANLSTPGQVAD